MKIQCAEIEYKDLTFSRSYNVEYKTITWHYIQYPNTTNRQLFNVGKVLQKDLEKEYTKHLRTEKLKRILR